MKRLLPVVLLLVVAVALLALWVSRNGADAPAEAEPAQPAQASGEAEQPPELVDLPPDESEPGAALLDPTAPEAEQRREAGLRNFDPALARRVEGQVVVPPGTPSDELLAVVALAGERAPSPLPESLRETDAEDVLARADVDATGAFELGLPPDVEQAWVVLEARYLRSSTAPRVPLGEDDEPLVLRPELGGWVSGRVELPPNAALDEIDPDDRSVVLAPDRMAALGVGGVRAEPREQRRRARLDEQLSFEWGGVASGVRIDVRLRTDAFAAVKTEAFELRPGEHREVALVLTRGGRLSGSVRDDSGAPVVGARVVAEVDPVMMGLGGWEVRRGETGEDGGFELSALPAGNLILRTNAEGLLDGRDEVELAAGEERTGLAIELERGSTIAGSLRWPDGAPVADVPVRAEFDPANLGGIGALNAMRGPRGDARTGEDGSFAIRGLGQGPFVVRAAAEREGEEWRARRDGVAPDTADLELVLAAPLALEGRVVDEHGQPIVAFGVRARSQTGGFIPGLGGETASQEFEHEQGRFRLTGLAQGDWVVVASGEGYGRGDELEVALPAAGEVELRLPHAAAIHGVVLSPEGQPVQGATVEQDLGLQGLVARAEEGGEAPQTETDADGHFELAGLTPGSVSIAARREGFARSEAVPFDIGAAEVVEGAVLTLRRGGRILGEVFGGGGDPLVGVTIIAQQPTALTDQRFATSDGEGRFVFDSLTPGTWQVLTMPGGGALEELGGDDFAAFFSDMKMQMVEVVEGEDTHVVLGAPAADPVHVTGRVLVDGEPQAGVLVSFIPDGAVGMQSFKFTSAGKDGGYALDLDQPGDYLVQVQQISGAPGQQQNVQLRVDVPDERRFEVDLELPVGRISGRVRGPDGEPLGGARISLTVDGPVSNRTFMGGQYAEIASDADGRYSLLWLRPGTYTIAAGGPAMGGMFGGDGGDAPGREVRDGVRLREGEHVDDVDFRLRAPGRLKGLVRDAGGRPVADAAVFLRDDAGRLVERISLVASDSSGRFTYGGLAPGDYWLSMRSTELVSPADSLVTVREGEDTSVELALAPGTILLVLLSDREGNPVDCEVTVLDENDRQVNGSWSLNDLMAMMSSGSYSSKEQRVGPLPPGRYRVLAAGDDGRSATKPVVLSGQPERKLNLRLKD